MTAPVKVGSATASCDSLAPFGAGGGNPVRPIIGSFTIPSLVNGCLIVPINNINAIGDCVIWDGLGTQYPLTLGGACAGTGSSYYAELWYLLSPVPGTYQVYRNGGSTLGGAIPSWWSGVNQVTPFPTGFQTFRQVGGGSATSVTLSAVPSNCVCIDSFGTRFSGNTPQSGQTAIAEDVTDSNGGFAYINSSYIYSPGSVPMTWNPVDGGIVAAAMQGVSSPTTTQRRTLIRGMGRGLNRGYKG